MNPEVKKIGDKLFDKVELASQKVELALADDIKALIGKYKGLDDNVKTTNREAYTLADSLSATGGFLEIINIISFILIGGKQKNLFY